MAATEPAFATDVATARYYESRAGECDHWYEGRGLFAGRDRPGTSTSDRSIHEHQ